jgi:hypothetical protein
MSLSALLLVLLLLSTLLIVESNSRKRWAGYGLVWGMAALTNPALLSILPLSLVWMAIKRRQTKQSHAIPLLLVMASLMACTAPWMVRNRVVLGKSVFLRDNFWFEFHLGNYHLSNGMGWGGKHPTGNIIELNLYKKAGELNYIDHYRAESMAFVRTYPREFVEVTRRRFVTFWTGDFFHYRWWETPSYVALSFLGLMGLILGYRAEGIFLFANILLCYPLAYYVTYPFPRYRHAIEPELLILSSYFLCELVLNFRDRFFRRLHLRAKDGALERAEAEVV